MSPQDPEGACDTPFDEGIQRHRRLITNLNACLEVSVPACARTPSVSDMRVRSASQYAVELLGARHAGQLLYRSLGNFIFGESIHIVEDIIHAALVGKEASPVLGVVRALNGHDVAARLSAMRWTPETICLVFTAGEQPRDESPRLQIIEQRYGRLFNDAPIALMRVDCRSAISFFVMAREAGYDDLVAYIDDHPAAFEAALDATVIVEANDESVKMFGDGSKESVLCPVRSYYRLAPDAMKRNMAAAFAGTRHYSEEIILCGAAGQEIDVLLTISFPEDQELEGNSFVAIVAIGDRLRTEAELQRTQGEFTRAARISLMGELTASIAHEIMQPLSSISVNSGTALKWLAKDPPDIERASLRLRRVSQEAERMGAIVHGIRAMVKGGNGASARVDLNDLALDALAFVQDEARAHGVRLRFQRSAVPLHITVDPVQLQQVVVNLVTNAVQAIAQQRAAAREVVILVAPTHDRHAELVVSDTGPGIAEDVLPRMFDSFFTTKSDGIGMGLAICKSIVEHHRGTLTMENAEGVGAVARVRLPASAAQWPHEHPMDPCDAHSQALPAPPSLPSYGLSGTKL